MNQAFDFDNLALQQWEPLNETRGVDLDPQWSGVIDPFWRSECGAQLSQFLVSRLKSGARIYPPAPFRALELTPVKQVNIVILGQDPYHGEGQALGLAFSVSPGVKLPPSLVNIFKELERDPDISGFKVPLSGNLESWGRRGVLLLNTTLTVEQGAPASHAGQGWEILTDQVIALLSAQKKPLVFMLWGAHAQSKVEVIRSSAGWREVDRLILTSNHPSPLSALRGKTPFIGNCHFSLAQSWLAQRGIEHDWVL